MFAHGGSFINGDKREFPIEDYCEAMARRGFVVLSINYRLMTQLDFVVTAYHAVQDMRAAIRWTKAHADPLRIDPNLVFAAGNSAGGIMAVLTGYADNHEVAQISGIDTAASGPLDGAGGYSAYSGNPAAIVNTWGAILDTGWMAPGDIPVISFHGDIDIVIPLGSGFPYGIPLVFPLMHGSQLIMERANNVGIPNELHIFPGQGHEPWKTAPHASDDFDPIVVKS